MYPILSNDPLPVAQLHGHRGPVEIEGQAVEGDDGTVESPLTGTRCLAYSYKLEEYVREGGNRKWATVGAGMDGVEFVVDDGTGRVVVDPNGADINCQPHSERVRSGREPPNVSDAVEFIDSSEKVYGFTYRRTLTDDVVESVDSNEKAFGFSELKQPTDDADEPLRLIRDNKQRYTERRLHPGDDVHVYGQARRGPSVEWGSSLVDVMVGDGDEAPMFVISDTDQGGAARRVAWRGLRKAGFGLLITLWLGGFFVLLM
ncbi:GIDE domain-containing protein [Haloarcula salinisoli]|uniref:RING-type E3 ubiquitin transferase n=1 Tax=Haloarcula salinisoli TaxID=2487746 RepID=A0A8J8C8Z2_9EURY|nr:GIDE domain-containing protein [Halomicroarcula salinisoli]MBX0287375.1 hypothetical protein [Halomicroarcula salinisoli]MBX0305051.1 hypothetical protein [Halomicroarcula salinisoli]